MILKSLTERIFSLLNRFFVVNPRLPQLFSVSYTVGLKNNSNREIPVLVAIPVPPNTPTQTLILKPTFTPNTAATRQDSKFGNSYAVWPVKLTPGHSEPLTAHFIISTKPNHPALNQKLTLNDYSLTDAQKKFCESSVHLQVTDEIKLIAQQAANTNDLLATIKGLNQYVITRLNYGDPITGLYSSSDALRRARVDCGGFDSLLIALCRALGIPARIVSGFWARKGKSSGHDLMHAWVEIMMPDGSWLPADPSVEKLRSQGRTRRVGGLGDVGSDRVIFSFGADIPVQINDQIVTLDILQTPVLFFKNPHDQGQVQLDFSVICICQKS